MSLKCFGALSDRERKKEPPKSIKDLIHEHCQKQLWEFRGNRYYTAFYYQEFLEKVKGDYPREKQLMDLHTYIKERDDGLDLFEKWLDRKNKKEKILRKLRS